MAFTFEPPVEQRRMIPSPRMIGLGVGAAVLIVGIVVVVVLVLRGRGGEPVIVQDNSQVSDQQNNGDVVEETPVVETTVQNGIQYNNPVEPVLIVGETKILSAEEKELYGFPPEVTVRMTIVQNENGKAVPKFEYVGSR